MLFCPTGTFISWRMSVLTVVLAKVTFLQGGSNKAIKRLLIDNLSWLNISSADWLGSATWGLFFLTERNSCGGISSQCAPVTTRDSSWKKERHFNLVQLSQFSQDKDPWDIYLIYKGVLSRWQAWDLKEAFINFMCTEGEKCLREAYGEKRWERSNSSLCLSSIMMN